MSKEETLKALNNLLSPERDDAWREKVEERRKNKTWLKKSMKIALRVLGELDKKKLSQAKLAELMEVSPQQVNKILKGRENLSLQTIDKMEQALGIELNTILASDEIVVKNTAESFAKKLAGIVLREHFNKQFVTQNINKEMHKSFASKKGEFNYNNFATVPLKQKIKVGETNYAMAA